MRPAFFLVMLLPGFTFAQTPDAAQKKQTIDWILAQEVPTGGFYLAPQDAKSDVKPQPGLRATLTAGRALKYLGAELPNKEKHTAFVLKCFDPTTGGFAEPGDKLDVTITSIGVIAAMDYGIPKEKFGKAMDYLKENAKTFEDVRIGAAAVEAWGVKECPFMLDEWNKIGFKHYVDASKLLVDPKDGKAREVGSLAAMVFRLGDKIPEKNWDDQGSPALIDGQRSDGGWNKKGEKTSDIESSYRVMRALYMLKEKPKDVKKLREFIASHRNKDGGYGLKPGDPSNMQGTYFAAVITKWLDELEKK